MTSSSRGISDLPRGLALVLALAVLVVSPAVGFAQACLQAWHLSVMRGQHCWYQAKRLSAPAPAQL